MGKLDGATLYLSGGIDNVQDCGVGWRREFIKQIKENNLKINCIDPTNKPVEQSLKLGEGLADKEYQEKLQKEGHFEELKKHVTKYRHCDLRFCDISDILVCYINHVPQWGTANEIYVSEMQHKPRFVICPGGLYKLPRWLFDVFELEDVFEDVNGVIKRLIEIDNGTRDTDEKWVLIRKYLESK